LNTTHSLLTAIHSQFTTNLREIFPATDQTLYRTWFQSIK
jgi:hypothetical protein